MSRKIGKVKVKPPNELLKTSRDAMELLLKGNLDKKPEEKARDELNKALSQMKVYLLGDGDSDPMPEHIQALGSELANGEWIEYFISHMNSLDFETRKDMAALLVGLVRRSEAVVTYLAGNPGVLVSLIRGYDVPETALLTGSILREAVRHETITQVVLHLDVFDEFFNYVEVSNFDVASDAFSCFRECLLRHRQICTEYLDSHYEPFFANYSTLLNSTNYVTRRQSLKLLSEILLDKSNFSVMTRYISSTDNLKLSMNLLRDKSKNIQFEAFHVFKVFVANPNKPPNICDILMRNKDRLVSYLNSFQNDREDEQFREEKLLLIKEISSLSIAVSED